MSDRDDTAPEDRTMDTAPQHEQDDPIQRTIDTLTALAREERTIGAGKPSEHQESVDFAGILAGIVTSVAANMGGSVEVLAGRSGSWEADLVRQLVNGTAGDDPSALLRYRTEPIEVEYSVDYRVERLGFEERDEVELEGLSAEGQKLDDELEEYGTATEQQQLHDSLAAQEVLFDILHPLYGPYRPSTAEDEAEFNRLLELNKVRLPEYRETIRQRARVAGDPVLEAIAANDREVEAIEQRAEEDRATYAAAFEAALRAKLDARGVRAPVVLRESHDDFVSFNLRGGLDGLIDDAHAAAAAATYARRFAGAPGAAAN